MTSANEAKPGDISGVLHAATATLDSRSPGIDSPQTSPIPKSTVPPESSSTPQEDAVQAALELDAMTAPKYSVQQDNLAAELGQRAASLEYTIQTVTAQSAEATAKFNKRKKDSQDDYDTLMKAYDQQLGDANNALNAVKAALATFSKPAE